MCRAPAPLRQQRIVPTGGARGRRDTWSQRRLCGAKAAKDGHSKSPPARIEGGVGGAGLGQPEEAVRLVQSTEDSLSPMVNALDPSAPGHSEVKMGRKELRMVAGRAQRERLDVCTLKRLGLRYHIL